LAQVVAGATVLAGMSVGMTNSYRESFDADQRADLAAYYPANGYWIIWGSTNGPLMQPGGNASMVPVPQDYDGDGTADIAVFDTRDGTWHFKTNGVWGRSQWGGSRDVPVPGDYTGDGAVDFAVYRPSVGIWYVKNSRDGSLSGMRWGSRRQMPVPGDYDGDEITDIAVFEKDSGYWHIVESGSYSNNASLDSYWRKVSWGNPRDIGDAVPVPADYDNDGEADVAIYDRVSGLWHILESDGESYRKEKFGWSDPTLIPVPGDYDGDGIVDLAVFYPRQSLWYYRSSLSRDPNDVTIHNWGWRGVIPADFGYTVYRMHTYLQSR